ncbi:MAG: TerC family protein [Elusimicrobiota bacterium]
MDHHNLLWVIFAFTALSLFILDLRLSAGKAHVITAKESIALCSFWILIASLYGFLVGYLINMEKMFEYFTAYVIEYSLSVDNMFVFLMIFNYFSIEKEYQPKILTWGILGAVVMRMIMIFSGVALVERFHWIIYFFGLILIYTAFKMYFQGEEKIEPEKNPILKFLSKFIPFDLKTQTHDFFIKKDAKTFATVMFAALIVVESTDLVFAVDSIPAVLAISTDKLIVYTSNVFAVVGLRSLYFLLAYISDYFRYLKKGVSVVLFYVGGKMLISSFYKISPVHSLFVVLSILAFSIVLSVIIPSKKAEK